MISSFSFSNISIHLLSEVKVAQSCRTLCDPMDYTVGGILQARILDWVPFPFSRGIFPNQGSNPGLPHCRRILYQLSHQGSPKALREDVFLLLLSRSVVRTRHQVQDILCLVAVLLQFLPRLSLGFPPCMCLSVSSSLLTKTPVIEFRIHLMAV